MGKAHSIPPTLHKIILLFLILCVLWAYQLSTAEPVGSNMLVVSVSLSVSIMLASVSFGGFDL